MLGKVIDWPNGSSWRRRDLFNPRQGDFFESLVPRALREGTQTVDAECPDQMVVPAALEIRERRFQQAAPLPRHEVDRDHVAQRLTQSKDCLERNFALGRLRRRRSSPPSPVSLQPWIWISNAEEVPARTSTACSETAPPGGETRRE